MHHACHELLGPAVKRTDRIWRLTLATGDGRWYYGALLQANSTRPQDDRARCPTVPLPRFDSFFSFIFGAAAEWISTSRTRLAVACEGK